MPAKSGIHAANAFQFPSSHHCGIMGKSLGINHIQYPHRRRARESVSAMNRLLCITAQAMKYTPIGCVAVGLLCATAYEHPHPFGMPSGTGMVRTRTAGWPLVCLTHKVFVPWGGNASQSHHRRNFNFLRVAGNITSCAAILASSFVVSTVVMPRLRTRRWSLSSMLIAVTVVAVLVQVVHHDWEYSRTSIGFFDTYHPVTAYPWWIAISLFYGVSCMMLSTCLLARHVASVVARRVATV